jgi:hypothetical protein
VQTLKSLIWRRRFYELYAGEVRLFKTEGVSIVFGRMCLACDGSWDRGRVGSYACIPANVQDASPIQTIPLGAGTTVSQTYEESQVQESFKVSSRAADGSGGEDFFLFTDSSEDKEALLEALGVALGAA